MPQKDLPKDGKDEKAKNKEQSPSVSPERRNRRQDLNAFEQEVNKTSVPRKSHKKSDHNHLNERNSR